MSGTGVTARDVVFRDGSASLLRFRGPAAAGSGAPAPLLLVPSLINRWYVLDLAPGASVVAALLEAGIDTYCLDWGVPGDEDRYLGWDEVIERLCRCARAAQRHAGAERIALLGYCMGGTLCAIGAALDPGRICALVNLAGPIDFAHAGILGHLVDARWFDPEAMSCAGNISAWQMQSGFMAMRPTLQLAKLVGLCDRLGDDEARARFLTVESWANDNVPFPAAAYVRYIRDLYQRNELVAGEHRIRSRRVDLAAVDCPVLTVVTERDEICPPPCATALNRLVGSTDTDILCVPGGHVGAGVGSRAARELYPRLVGWLVGGQRTNTNIERSVPQ
ncbi:MAG: alpha/beta fold hydrolase [Deltaproteobacteria bacterium]|nr:alpha/beta fold hydrolase [Deltaproteobacteria bacterium]